MGSLGLVFPQSVAVDDERAAQKSYWGEHSAVASVEAMLLDSQAAMIDQQERPEVWCPATALTGAPFLSAIRPKTERPAVPGRHTLRPRSNLWP